MYAIYGNIYHQYTPNVSIYTIHGSYGFDIREFSIPVLKCIGSLNLNKTYAGLGTYCW